jgi:hypothetical protein
LGSPLVAFRAGIGEEGADLIWLKEHLETQTLKQNFFVNGIIAKDSKVGHSTVFNVKAADKSLLIDANYNPFINSTDNTTGKARGYSQGTLWQLGMDYSAHLPLSEKTGLDAQAEIDYGQYANDYGQIQLAGATAQAAYYFKPFEVALRYGLLIPDAKMTVLQTGASTQSITIFGANAAPIHELTPSLTWFLKGEQLKLTLDFPVYLNMAVAQELNPSPSSGNPSGVGAYVLLPQQPGQTSLLKTAGNTIVRQTVVEARLGLQYLF